MARIKGFVYKEDGLGVNQLVLTTFLITYCIVDARIIIFLTEFEQASKFQQDTWLWLEIRGSLKETTYIRNYFVAVYLAVGWVSENIYSIIELM